MCAAFDELKKFLENTNTMVHYKDTILFAMINGFTKIPEEVEKIKTDKICLFPTIKIFQK